MAKKKDISVEKKLRALFDLQLIDSRIDEIKSVRGELPLEVKDLEDEISGYNTKMAKLNEEIKDYESNVKDLKNSIEQAKELIKKYSEKLKNVRNNREYNSIVKEEEYQKLEIELAEKKIKDSKVLSEEKNTKISELQEKLDEKNKHLEAKKGELDEILNETKKEEDILLKQSEIYEQKIDEQLIKAYKRIRLNVKNGLAIVPIERGASGGSFFTIPPQIQMEIASRQKIITDEFSGRILIDPDLAKEEKAKISKLIKSL